MAVYKTVQGLVHNYGGLLGTRSPFLIPFLLVVLTPRTATRWMLGMMEAGLYPGVVYYLSWYIPLPFFGSVTFSDVLSFSFHSWYKRSEYGIRAAVFFSAATVSGAFGGLLAVRAPISREVSDS
jgi:hypothetical protein